MKLIRILTILMMFNYGNLFAFGSTGTRGGGNVSAAEFSNVATDVINQLLQYPQAEVNGVRIQASKMDQKFRSTKVFVSVLPLQLNGKYVSAINDWKLNEIVFFLSDWNKLSFEERRLLVLHELLGLAYHELNDQGYIYSRALLKLTKPSSSTTVVEEIQCAGSEPYWSASFSNGKARFKWEDLKINFGKVVYSGAGVTEKKYVLGVNATDGSSELSGFITLVDFYDNGGTAPKCNTGAGNMLYPYSVQFFLNGKAYTGCCETKSKPAVEGEY